MVVLSPRRNLNDGRTQAVAVGPQRRQYFGCGECLGAGRGWGICRGGGRLSRQTVLLGLRGSRFARLGGPWAVSPVVWRHPLAVQSQIHLLPIALGIQRQQEGWGHREGSEPQEFAQDLVRHPA